jgi:hypothetical protein
LVVPSILTALGQVTTHADLDIPLLDDAEKAHWMPDIGREHELRLLMGLDSAPEQGNQSRDNRDTDDPGQE